MKILYIFPHPSDEAFGPAAAIHKQIEAGHEVGLLTLTKGESSISRISLGISKQELAKYFKDKMLYFGFEESISNCWYAAKSPHGATDIAESEGRDKLLKTSTNDIRRATRVNILCNLVSQERCLCLF